jgi:RNA polymerase sigma-70 factor (ECF subfamily)
MEPVLNESSFVPDEELALEAARGHRRAFEELVCRYSARLRHFLRHRVSSDQDAEDLVQDTFLKACRNIASFDPDYRFSTWIYTIAYRLAVSRYRSLKRTRVPLEPDPSPEPPEELVFQRDRARRLWKAAKKLNHSYYQALWLRYGEDMSIKEMSGVMRKSSSAVRVTLHRARLNLGRLLMADPDTLTAVGRSSAGQKVSLL